MNKLCLPAEASTWNAKILTQCRECQVEGWELMLCGDDLQLWAGLTHVGSKLVWRGHSSLGLRTRVFKQASPWFCTGFVQMSEELCPQT
jgi:hypothetical protein